jgi:hypothetical protein
VTDNKVYYGKNIQEVFALYDIEYNKKNCNKIIQPFIEMGYAEKLVYHTLHNKYDAIHKYQNTNMFYNKMYEILEQALEKNNKDCIYLVNEGTFKNLKDAHDYMDNQTIAIFKESENSKMLKKLRDNNFNGYVYFIQCHNNHFIKIGYTKDIKARLQIIQSNNPEQIDILNIIMGTEKLESQIHNQLSKYKIRGEWYYPKQEVVNLMNQYVDKYGIKNEIIQNLLT